MRTHVAAMQALRKIRAPLMNPDTPKVLALYAGPTISKLEHC